MTTDQRKNDHNSDRLILVVLASVNTNTLLRADVRSDRGLSARPKFRSRITKRVRDDVVRLYESGLTSRAVAEETKLGKTTVLKILKQEGAEVRAHGAHY